MDLHTTLQMKSLFLLTDRRATEDAVDSRDRSCKTIFHFIRESDFGSKIFVDRFTTLNYAFVIARTDCVADAL
jgi:hypothetical protein